MTSAALSSARVATADWCDLVAELDCWGEAGRIASLWWRDDDAATATPELAGLRRIAGRTPLALAVIPEPATASLAEALNDTQSIGVLQHGWTSCEPRDRGQKKRISEPASRFCRGGRGELRDESASPRCSASALCRSSCRRGTASRPNCFRSSRQAASRPCQRSPRRKRPAARPSCQKVSHGSTPMSI